MQKRDGKCRLFSVSDLAHGPAASIRSPHIRCLPQRQPEIDPIVRFAYTPVRSVESEKNQHGVSADSLVTIYEWVVFDKAIRKPCGLLLG